MLSRASATRPIFGEAPRSLLYLALLVVAGPALFILGIVVGSDLVLRSTPLALGVVGAIGAWSLVTGSRGPLVTRIARVGTYVAGFAALVGVVIQVPRPFGLAVIPLLVLIVIGLAAARAHSQGAPLGVVPGVSIGQAERVFGPWRTAAAAVAGALAIVALTALIPAVAVVVIGAVAVAFALVVAAGRRVAKPTARAVTIVGATIALLLVPFRGVTDVPIGGAALGLSDVAIAVAFVAWLMKEGRSANARVPGYAVGAALFTAWLGITSVWAFEIGLVVKEMTKWAEITVAIALLADVLRDPIWRQRVALAVVVAVVAEALIGLAQTVSGLGPGTFAVGGVIRAFGTFDQPNPFGGYLGLHLPMLLAAAIYVDRRRRWWVVLAWLIVFAAIIVSRSRGAWLGVGLSSVVVVLAAAPRMRRMAIVVVGLLVATALTFAGLVIAGGLGTPIDPELRSTIEGRLRIEDTIQRRVFDDYPVADRVAQWLTGWRMFNSRPLTGVGAGNFDEAYGRYRLSPFAEPVGHAHNVYINFAAEAGLVGLVGIVSLMVWAFARGVRAIRRSRGTPSEWLAIGALGGIVAFATHNLVDSLLVSGMGLIFAAFIALTYALEWRQSPQRFRAESTVT